MKLKNNPAKTGKTSRRIKTGKRYLKVSLERTLQAMQRCTHISAEIDSDDDTDGGFEHMMSRLQPSYGTADEIWG